MNYEKWTVAFRNRLISAAAWGCLIFIVFATISPLHMRPTLTETEPTVIVMLERFGAFAVLGFLFLINYRSRVALVCIIVLGSATMLELVQIFIPGRDARLVDAVEKMTGGAFGIFTAQWIMSRLQARILNKSDKTISK